MRNGSESDVMLSELNRNRDLAATVVELTDGNKTSKEDIRDYAAMDVRLKEDMNRLHDRLDAIMKRAMPISIRENEICKDMFSTETVSNDAIKRHFLYSAENIVQCAIPEVVTARTDYLARHNLTDDHLFCIAQLKEMGNMGCHHPLVLTRREWNDLITNFYLIIYKV